MKKTLFILQLLIISFVFCQDEITHISKVYSDGTPKEVIIYRQVSDNLRSDNPFEIIEKINYDTKGNYIRPKLTGDAAIAQNWIIGEWIIGEWSESNVSVKFNRDGSYDLYEDGVFDESESGVYYFEQVEEQVILRVKEIDVKEIGSIKINFVTKDELTIEFPNGRVDTLLRLK